MNLKSTFLVIFSAMIALVDSYQFPTDQIEQCTPGDMICINRVIEFILLNRNQGIQGLNLVSLEPLYIDKMDIANGGNSPVRIVLNFKDIALSGISQGKIQYTKGFERDFDGKKMEIKVKFPGSVVLAGNYKISGQVLILPIQGNGNCNLTLNNFDFVIKFLPKAVVRNGQTYLSISKAKSQLQNVKRLYMNFENLFDGNRALGDNMNLFLNENWKEIFEELRVAIEASFADIFKGLVNRLFTTLPYNQMFKDF